MNTKSGSNSFSELHVAITTEDLQFVAAGDKVLGLGAGMSICITIDHMVAIEALGRRY